MPGAVCGRLFELSVDRDDDFDKSREFVETRARVRVVESRFFRSRSAYRAKSF